MPDDAPESLSREQRLDEAVTAFLEAQEAGKRPLRQDWLARYPEVAAELEHFFTDQDEVDRLTGPLRAAFQGTPPPGETPQPGQPDGASASLSPSALAAAPEGYELLKVLGQGGMGLVYRARQKNAGRLVALKLIRAERLASESDVQRFRNEAEAAAQLDHPHIVPVYEVGSRQGHFFFSMKLIDGGGLDEQLARFRDDLPGAVRLLAQVARAVHHAHQRGILHRDLKPSNILLDREGQPHVSDFGLAKRVEADASLTQTGAIVGTPQFMAPEQTQGRKGAVTTATDVYGLGAVLYALLTGRSPFRGETVLETLEQVREREPEPPRRDNPKVDRDLETICLKCLQKEPQRRYESAQAVAEDLERWLRGEPVAARPPGWADRLWRWIRRHRSAAWAAASLTLILMVVGIVNALLWMQQRTASATEARAALQEAERWQQEERWSEALSAVRRAQGVLRGFGSNASLRQQADELAKDLEMAQRLEEAELQHTAIRDGHYDYEGSFVAYRKAFAQYGLNVEHLDAGAAAEYIRSRSIRNQLLSALDLWARSRRLMKDQEWKHLLAVARAVDADQWRNRWRDAWERGDGKALREMLSSADVEERLPSSVRLLDISRFGQKKPFDEQALALLGEQALTLLRRAQQRHPADFWINHDLAYLLRTVQPPQLEEAIGYYRAAVALRPQSPGVHIDLGDALKKKGRLDEAIAEYREAIRLKKNDAEAHVNLGIALRDKGRLDEAIAEHKEALRLKKDSANAHINLGIALKDKGQLDEAIAEYKDALRITKDNPFAHTNLGIALKDKGQLDEAIAEQREAIRIDMNFAVAHNNLGVSLYAKGQLDEAIAEHREAIRLKKDFAETHHNLGDALYAKGRLDEAIAEFKEAIRIKKDFAAPHNNLGNTLRLKGLRDEAIAEYKEAIRLQKDLAETHCNLAELLKQKGQFAESLMYLRRGHELGSRNPRWPYPSAQWVRDGERWLELDGKLSAVLSGEKQPTDSVERLTLAQLCQLPCKRLHAAATRFYSTAFADKPQLADDLNAQHRYNAACAAALAGCGQGKDADKLDEKERLHWRQQALDWLRADLKAYRQLLEKSAGKAGPAIAQRMQHWLQDPDFAGVRTSEALARMPEASRKDWQEMWKEVESLRQRAAERPKAKGSARP